MIALESYVNNDVAGFTTFETKASGGDPWATTTIAGGYRLFSDWLAALSTALGSFTFAYDTATDRVTLTPASGGLYFRFGASFAELIGFATEPGSISVATSGTSAPAGIVPLYSADFGKPTPARQSDLRAWSHGRARGLVWGEGEMYRAQSPILYSNLDRALSGPCTAGRVRIGTVGGSDIYGSANLDGYIDGHVLKVHDPAGLDSIEGVAQLTLDVHAGATPSAPDPFEPCYGSLVRGYSWALYAKIEGLAYRFCEVDPGWTDSARPASATLVMDPSTTLSWRANRERGIAGGGPLRVGIMDPDNTTGIWGRPSKSAELATDLTATATTIEVTDVSDFSLSGGTVYVGKERITYTHATTGTTPHQITGCTRGAVNDKYTHVAEGGGQWTTLHEKPYVWAGRFLELHAALLDPFGRAVGSDWEDSDATTMLFRGEITGAPGYDGGLWILHAHSLEKRLTRELSVAGSGSCFHGLPAGINEQASSGTFPPIVVSDTESIRVTFIWKDEYKKASNLTVATILAEEWAKPPIVSSGTRHLVDMGAFLYDLFLASWKLPITVDPTTTAASWAGGNTATIGAYSGPSIYKMTRDEETGAAVFYLEDRGPSVGLDMSPYVKIIYGPRNNAPSWWTSTIIVEEGTVWGTNQVFPTGTLDSLPMTTGATGKTIDSMVLTADPDEAGLMGSWPSSGFYMASGSEDEIGSYNATLAAPAHGVIALYGLTRAKHGTAAADVWDPETTVEAVEEFTGSYGSQLLTMMESSGLSLRGTYDTKSAHAGYGLDDGQIDESSILATLAMKTPVLIAGETSLEKTYGSLLAALRLNIGPVRSGQALKLGAYTTRPLGSVTQKLRDADLRLTRGPSVERVNVGPNIVKIEHDDAPGIDMGTSITFRLAADITARGGVRRTYKIPGLKAATFSAVAQSAGIAIMLNGHDLIAYRFRVGGHKDWLVGQIVDIDVSHPGIWDWSANTTGLDAVGVILETRRNLSGEVDVVIVVGGAGRPGALVPAVKISGRSGSDLTMEENSFPNGEPVFLSGDGCLLYRPGVDAEYTESTIASVSGLTATLDTVPGWLSSIDFSNTTTGIVYMSYPSDNDADMTAAQAAFAHISDGTIWS